MATRIPMAVYVNKGDKPLKLEIGNGPGDPPNVYKADGGKEVEGPLNYREVFERNGFRFVRQIETVQDVPSETDVLRKQLADLQARVEAMAGDAGKPAKEPAKGKASDKGDGGTGAVIPPSGK